MNDEIIIEGLEVEESVEIAPPVKETLPEVKKEAPVQTPLVFNVNGTVFTLKYNIDKIAAFEEAICPNTSLVYLINANKGCLSLNALRTLFTLGLTYMQTGKPVNNGELAVKIFKAIVQKEGVMEISSKVIEKVYNDCPFLFQL